MEGVGAVVRAACADLDVGVGEPVGLARGPHDFHMGVGDAAHDRANGPRSSGELVKRHVGDDEDRESSPDGAEQPVRRTIEQLVLETGEHGRVHVRPRLPDRRGRLFGDDVETLGHEATRAIVAAGGSASGTARDAFVVPIPGRITALERDLEAAAEAERPALERELATTRAYGEALAEIAPVPPTMTLAERMTLHRGGHEIQLLWFGRGHPPGDVVVFLPERRVLVTGDLIPFGLPFMGDGFPEWGDTIRAVAELDFEVVLPGHGPPFEGRERLPHPAAYLDDSGRARPRPARRASRPKRPPRPST